MPELPEAETARATLETWLSGRRLVRARVVTGPPVRSSAASIRRALTGALAGSAQRRGKHLLLPFRRADDQPRSLHLHLGMTGRIVVTPASASEPRFSRRIYRATLIAPKRAHLGNTGRLGS